MCALDAVKAALDVVKTQRYAVKTGSAERGYNATGGRGYNRADVVTTDSPHMRSEPRPVLHLFCSCRANLL